MTETMKLDEEDQEETARVEEEKLRGFEPDDDWPCRDEELGELVAALARAQGSFGTVKKSRTATVPTRDGKSYSYSYPSLADLVDAIRGPLAENGIAWTQDVTNEPGAIAVELVLRRGTAELRFGPLRVPAGNDAQAIGSATTYARRYQLQTALGIAAEEDDDGAAAAAGTVSPPKSSEKLATPATMKRLHALARTRGVSHEQMRDWAGRNLGIESLTELTRTGAAEMEKSLSELPEVPEEDRPGSGEQEESDD